MIDACKKVGRARREYEVMYGRTPTDEELSSATGISMERIQRMSWSLIDQPLSLSLPATRDGESSLADTLVANTEDERSELIHLYGARPDQVEVVHPGVDVEVFRPGRREEARARLGVAPAAHVLLFAGRIQPRSVWRASSGDSR